jgi:hypothetical protein
LVAVTTTRLDESVVRAIRSVRPNGLVLTHLSPGYTDPAIVDATARMIGRITRVLDNDPTTRQGA